MRAGAQTQGPPASLPAPRGALASLAVALGPAGLFRRAGARWELRPVSIADPVQVLELAVALGARQLWIGPAAAETLGIPPDFAIPFEQRELPTHRAHVPAPWVQRAVGAGWVASVPGWNPWLELERGDVRLDVVLPAWGDNPFRRSQGGTELLEALDLFAQAVGIRYHRSPGITGLSLMRAVHASPGGIPLETGEHLRELPPPCLEPSDSQAGGSWIAATLPTAGWLHCWDVNGMFLAACSSAELGFGAARFEKSAGQFVPGEGFHPGPGYYRARVTLGDVATPFKADGRPHWYTPPALDLLRELGAAITITEAWTYPQRHRWLEPWYVRLRDARTAYLEHPSPAASVALAALKDVYTRALGRLAGRWLAPGDASFRPDWRDVVVDRARANLHRHIARAQARSGVHVLAVDADALVYPSSFEDPAQAAAELGLDVHPTQLGKLKHRWVLSAEAGRQAAGAGPRGRSARADGLRRLRALLAAGEASR